MWMKFERYALHVTKNLFILKLLLDKNVRLTKNQNFFLLQVED